MEQRVRVGVVGAGALSQRVQLPALGRIKGARAVAVVDTNAERARECAAQFGIDASYTDVATGDWVGNPAGVGRVTLLVPPSTLLMSPVVPTTVLPPVTGSIRWSLNAPTVPKPVLIE